MHSLSKETKIAYGIKNYECKSPLIASLEKPIAFKISEDKTKKDFLSVYIRDNAFKLPSTHYEVTDKEGFGS